MSSCDLQTILQVKASTARDHISALSRLGFRSSRDGLRLAVERGGADYGAVLDEIIDDGIVLTRAIEHLRGSRAVMRAVPNIWDRSLRDPSPARAILVVPEVATSRRSVRSGLEQDGSIVKEGDRFLGARALADVEAADRLLGAVRTILRMVSSGPPLVGRKTRWTAALTALGMGRKDLQAVLGIETSTARDHLAKLRWLGFHSSRDALRVAVARAGGDYRALLAELIADPAVVERAADVLETRARS